tara:strand:+ start:261 stop:491 length:231 start_codon:yes stop_codon:yes gene_type:complete
MAENFGKYKEELQKRSAETKKNDTKNRKVIVQVDIEMELPYDQTEREKVLYHLNNLFLNTGIDWKYKTHTSYKYWN